MTARSKAVSHSNKTEAKSSNTSRRGLNKRKEIEESLREQQIMLATAEEIARVGSWKWDLLTQKVTWSDEMFRLFGAERDGFDGDVNRIVAERIHPDDAAAVAESNRKVLEEGQPIPMSYRIVLPDGRQRTVWAQGQLIRDENGQAIALMGYVQDITERVEAEKKIDQMKRLYATLSQVNQMIVRVKDRDELYRTICDVSIKFGEFAVAWIGILDEGSGDVRPVAATGVDVNDWPLPIVNLQSGPLSNGLVSRAIRTSIVVTSADAQADQQVRVLHGQLRDSGFHSTAVVPFRLRGRTIGSLTLISQEFGLFNDEAEVRLLDEMGLDISFALDAMETDRERKLMENELNEARELFQKIFSLSPMATTLARISDRTIVDINSATEKLLGYTRDELIGKPSPDFDYWADPEERQRCYEILLKESALRDYEFAFKTKLKKIGWAVLYVEIIELRGEKYVLSTFVDITERKLAEQALRASEERFRLLFENNHSVMLMIDPASGAIRNANEAATKFYGYSRLELCAMNISDINTLTSEEVYEERMRVVKEERDYFSFQHRLRNGEARSVEVYSTPIDVDGIVVLFSIIHDITERKRTEAALRESEERHRQISGLTSDYVYGGLIYLDGSVIIEWSSGAFEQITGYTREEINRLPGGFSSLVLPEDLDTVLEQQSLLVEKGANTIEYRIRRKNGTIYWIRDYLQVLSTEKPIHLLGAVQNITEHKQAERTLQESEARFSKIFHSSPTGINIFRLSDGRSVDVNPAFLELTGYSREEIFNHTALELKLFVDVHARVAWMKKLAQGESVTDQDAEIRHKSGEIRHVLASLHLIDINGEKMILVNALDITARKQMDEALKRSEHVLRLFVEHSPASIAMFDRDMKYIVASHRYLIDYRLGEQDLTGRSHYDVFPEIPERWKEIHRRCLAGAIEKAEEDPFPREDGTMDWVRWEIRPWYEQGGKIGGIILFSEVITERKQVQDELHLLNVELEKRVRERTLELSHANRAKDEFLANMSHELRTPLNTVLGLSESLLEQRRGPLNEKQAQSLELIASSGQHLLGLINDILEVSKIEAGKLELHPTTAPIKELCESSLNFIKEMALKKMIDVEFNNQSSVSALYVDPQRIKQVLINLLTNAVKFTPERGRVSLDVSTNEQRDQILFSVTDTGIGIATEDLKRLFTPFTQLDSSLARQYAGTGLGLALVHKLTELHGGGVRVESETGRGSRFTVALPISREFSEQISDENLVQSTRTEPGPAPLFTMTEENGVILLAEDNALNSEMLVEYLKAQGYRVIVAENGEEVLEQVEKVTPKIILMDIQMPKMDGLEATRRLRMDPRFASTPIIALTALAMPGDRERCLEAGANEYLSKPVSLRTLLQTIYRLTKPEG